MLEEKFEFYSPYNVNIHDLDPDLQNSLSVMQNLDFMTHKHCQNVGNLTARICTYMHFNSKFILHCLVAGYVHDVGKLFIDPKILHKDGKLTPEEFEIMKTHTTKGYEYCMKDHNLMYYSDGPWYHHEALNGTGYPRGLTKKDIPLSGQIIRVADEYDALVTKRHYKTHVNISETLKDMIVDTEPPKNVVALDFLKQNQHLGKINKKPLKALFKVVIDDILYDVLSLDPNSMSKWLPEINNAAKQTNFFKIPRTKILRVPKALLQTTRVLEFPELTPLSLEIINRYASEVFELDEEKDYFVKTGTFSSKFDFRNTKVTKGQEVKELGSYLWFIQHQASNLASPLNIPGPVYGVSSNNEWVVREFIDDKENNPTIYNGLPLHTEYRVFVDFDDKEVIGINPYWDPDVMKKNFLEVGSSKNSVKQHDYIIYSTHEEKLMNRYEENKELVMNEVRKLLDECNLTGQWSIDIMQNGDDFWLIDMARATESALVECVPKSKLKNVRKPFL